MEKTQVRYNISVCIMAHPKRKLQAEYLQAILKYYPFTEVTIAYDSENAGSHNEEWDNGTRALKAGLGKGDWHVVIQDDAILTPNFYENIEGAVSTVPTKSVISLYTGKARPLPVRVSKAVERCKNETWLTYWLLLWGVGIVIPTSHIEPLLEFVADRDEPYDTRIGIFYQRNRIPVYYTMPSLVDHDDDLPSLLMHGQAPEPRVAHKLATGPVKWNNKVINI